MKHEEYAIEVKDITKKFKIYYDKGSQLKERLLFKKRSRFEERFVLKGISFNVKKGEAVGLIGHNGCGKSTTLKLLTKIMYPDSGSITMRGRVSSLIELGAGFHPDMSGRENIYTNAAIFGLTKKEIDRRLDDIIAFSELEEFIDNPVRTYSSGMYMRLAFSVAINVDADILLIDEILAVGDTNFQTKCFNRLRELKASGMTIIIVTHDLQTIEKFCDSAIWINNGEIVKEGKSAAVVDAYFNFMNEKKIESLIKEEEHNKKVRREKEKEEEKHKNKPEEEPENKTETEAVQSVSEEQSDAENIAEEKDKIDYSANRFGLKYIEIKQARMINSDGIDAKIFHTGDSLKIEIDYKVNKPLDEYIFGFGFYTLEGVNLYGNNTQIDRLKVNHTSNSGTICVNIASLPLLAGRYILNVAVVDKDGVPMDFFRNYCFFDVISDDRSAGYLSVDHRWEIEK